MIKKFLCFLFLFRALIAKEVQFYKTPINQYTINHKWETIVNALNGPEVDAISIQYNVVSLAGMQKLYQQNLTKIRRLAIYNTNLNRDTMQFLMTNNATFQFEELILNQCSIFDQDLAHITPRETNITYLSLNSNSLTKEGFKYLNRLKMNLTKLSIQGNSLIHDQAVDSIIQMGLTSITSINLRQTSISSFNMIRIIQAMNLNKLEKLQMSLNHFQPEFYYNFSLFNFSSLVTLDITQLNIDEDGFKFFKNLKCPMLQTLIIKKNQLNNEMAMQFVTKQVMPKLKYLDIGDNFLNSSFIKHLRDQNFSIQTLKCSIKKIDINGFRQVSKIKSLINLTYQSNSATSQIMQQFIAQLNSSTMKELKVLKQSNKEDYFNRILKRKWPKLIKLTVQDIKSIDQRLYDQRIVFPVLQQININFITKVPSDERVIVNLIKNIEKIAPKIQKINIQQKFALYTIGSFFNGEIQNSLKNRLLIKIKSEYPLQNTFKICLFKDIMPNLMTFNIYVQFLAFQIYKTTKNDIIQSYTVYKNINNIFASVQSFLFFQEKEFFQNNVFRNFNFSLLQQLTENQYLDFIRRITYNNYNQYVFQSLQKLTLIINVGSEIQMFYYCQFPRLVSLSLLGQFSSLQGQFSLEPFRGKFPYINELIIGLQIEKQVLKDLLKSLQLINLNTIRFDRQTTGFNSSDLIQIDSYFCARRIKKIQYRDLFINDNLSFLSQSGALYQQLKIQGVIFNPGVINSLCTLNFQFLKQISLQSCAISNQQFVQLLICISSRHQSNSTINFPKLMDINLKQNYINYQGIQFLMKMGIPLLKNLEIGESNDGQMFSTIFSSPYSRRLQNFQINCSGFNGIDIDYNHRNTRKLLRLSFKLINLYQSDIKTLANFQLSSLEILYLNLKRIQNCKTLIHILQISETVNQLVLDFEESSKVNSNCLQGYKFKNSGIVKKNIQIKGSGKYGQISNLIGAILSNVFYTQTLALDNAYTFNRVLLNFIKQNNFQNSEYISIKGNQFDDDSGKVFFLTQLKNIEILAISDNPLSYIGLQTLNNKNFICLQYLDLSMTYIGDQGIQYLVRNFYPSLIYLDLSNIEMTGQGIRHLNNLKAPLLLVLDLSLNNLRIEDLLLLNRNRFPLLKKLIVYPQILRSEYDRLLKKFRLDQTWGLPITFELQTTIIQFDSLLEDEGYQGLYNDTYYQEKRHQQQQQQEQEQQEQQEQQDQQKQQEYVE